jgi:hypothetical protein
MPRDPRITRTARLAGLAALLAGAPALAQDFNGDGFEDLAVGTPGEDIGPNTDCGAVTVIYGSATGLNAFVPLPATRYTQTASGIEIDETGDNFGAAIAWGDFNNDGFDDLAIGIPGEDTTFTDAGAVAVLYGSPVGLSVLFTPWFIQPMIIGGDPDEAGDRFGASLASGDFNGDGFADLAIGAPGEDVGPATDAGMVNVCAGTPGGIMPGGFVPNPSFDQGMALLDPTELGDQFGGVLCAGDFNGDGSDDLAVSSEFEDIGAQTDAGGVTLIAAMAGVGLVPSVNAQWWTQNSPGIADAAQLGDRFGAALASGDFDHNFGDDLAIGVPGESIGLTLNTGVVHVIYSDAPGSYLNAFFPTPAQYYHQNSPGVPSSNATGDNFGASLAAFWNDGPLGYSHLAIGVPGNDIGANNDAGSVITIYSGGMAPIGLSATAGWTAPEIWNQNVAGIPQVCGAGDRFGTSITIGDYDNNFFQDLAVGVPFDNIGFPDSGCVNVIYGNPPFGLSLDAFVPVPAQLWQQNTPGIPDANEANDAFGSALDRR